MHPLDELNNRGRLSLQQALHDQLATSFHHRNRDGGLMNIHTDILFLIHKGAPFARLLIQHSQPIAKVGAFLYCV
jgi:hypothetical protein